jgi:protein TonB
MPAAPAPAPTIVQPPVKNSPAVPSANYEALFRREEVTPKPEKTVVLATRPSRILGGNDNSAPAPDAPAISSVGSVPASGSLMNLTHAVAPPPHLRSLTPSELEPIRVIKKVTPVYPLVAKTRRLSASVVVQGTVDRNGRINDLQLISGPPLYREAAFEALKQWVFKPAKLNGQPIDQTTTIRIEFGAQ